MKKSYTGAELLRATLDDSLPTKSAPIVIASVRASDVSDAVSLSIEGSAEWVDVPTSMIESATPIPTRNCNGEESVMFEIELGGNSTEAKVLLEVLKQCSRTNVHSEIDHATDIRRANNLTGLAEDFVKSLGRNDGDPIKALADTRFRNDLRRYAKCVQSRYEDSRVCLPGA